MFNYNMDIKTRDELIFGDYDPNKYQGGCRAFDDMSVEVLEKLVEMKFAYEEQHFSCCSPDISEFIDFMKENNGYVVEGYAITNERSNYGVYIDSIRKVTPITNLDDAKTFSRFHYADDYDVTGFAMWY